MAHPFNQHRDHKVQHERVSTITKACGGMASGGHTDVAEDKALVRKMVKQKALRADGGAVKARADRPARARGGRLNRRGKKGAKHTVNVIVAPQHQAPGMMPPMPHPAAPPGVASLPPGGPPGLPGVPPRPPMAGPMAGPTPAGGVPGGPAMPPGVPPPGLPRKRGGAVFSGTPNKVSVNAKRTTGSNKATSKTAGAGRGQTQISRSFNSNKQDTPNIGRGPAITKATGGTVNAAMTAEVPQRATGGPVMSDSKAGVDMGPEFTGGSRGGMAKLEKAARLARKGYGRPTISVKNPTQNPAT